MVLKAQRYIADRMGKQSALGYRLANIFLCDIYSPHARILFSGAMQRTALGITLFRFIRD